MQPNIVTGNRNQLGQYPARSSYGYEVPASAYRSNQRPMPNSSLVHQNTPMNMMPSSYAAAAASPAVFPSNALMANLNNNSDTIHILQPIPTPVPIKFRTIPFDKMKYEILKPSALNANHQITLPQNVKTSATQEFQFAFVMTCAMASEISMNRNITKNEYCVQLQLRITSIDVTTPPRPTEYDDFLPMGLVIRLNGRQCTQLPPCSPSTRQGQETRRTPRPILLTPLMRISPVNANILTVNWAAEVGKQYVVTLNIIEKLSTDFLMSTLKQRPRISAEITKQTIQQQYKPDGSESKTSEDVECAPTILRASLLCPLAKFRIQNPTKGKGCRHLQCFDGLAFISLNEKKTMWNCPVCNKPLFYDDLQLDEYFMDVLRNDELRSDCQEILLLPDGSWKVEDVGADGKKDVDATKSNSSPDRRQSTNSVDDEKRKVSSISECGAEGIVSNSDIVNLLSDDEDDEMDGVTTNESQREATVVAGEGNSTNGEQALKTPSEAAAEEGEASNGVAGNDTVSKMETDAEVQRTPSEAADPSTAETNGREGNPLVGIISLDSPSPPDPPVSDLRIRND